LHHWPNIIRTESCRIRRSGHAVSVDELQSKFKSKTMNEGKPERPGCVYQDDTERDLNEIDVRMLPGFVYYL